MKKIEELLEEIKSSELLDLGWYLRRDINTKKPFASVVVTKTNYKVEILTIISKILSTQLKCKFEVTFNNQKPTNDRYDIILIDDNEKAILPIRFYLMNKSSNLDNFMIYPYYFSPNQFTVLK